MGLGIAQVLAAAGHAVLATDAEPAARASAAGRLAAQLAERVAAGRLGEEEREAILGRLSVVDGPAAMGPAQLVVEAIVEEAGAKRALLAELESAIAPEAVLASNTSSLSVAALARGLRRPERVLGLHFFNPAPVQRLVELVRHDGTAAAALALARTIAEDAGKTVVEAPDRPGFIVNRCARPFYGEALALLEEGRGAAEVDAAMLAAGFRIGPFSLIDLIGADIHLAATHSVWEAMGRHPRYHVFQALEERVASGALGRKAGRGFVVPGRPGAPPADAPVLAARIEATVVNEAAWFLAEGGVAGEAIDTAVRLGLSFPRGPLGMLEAHGRARVLAVLRDLGARAPAHLRGRYDPAPLLEAA
jgi:3-hydroxybutyryl-CoA dehydrogenase